MILLLFLLLLLFLAGYGGIALSPLLWIVVAVILIAILIGPGIGGDGWAGGRWRRW